VAVRSDDGGVGLRTPTTSEHPSDEDNGRSFLGTPPAALVRN